MSGCLDNVSCSDCGIDWTDKRNAVASIVSSVLFFSGWWIIIDIAAKYPDQNQFLNAYYTCGCIGTLSFMLLNSVSNSQVRGDAMTEGVLGTRGARIFLLFGFVLGFGSVIAATWILFDAYVVNLPKGRYQWPGIALFLQNFLIFLANLIYKFGRTEELWG